MALPAEDVFILFRRFFVGFLFDQIRRRPALFFTGTFTK
jgi:hypothetical protein